MGMAEIGLQEVVEFFISDKGFHRLIEDMSVVHTRYGRTFGAVRLEDPSAEEEQALSAFFERDYFNQAMIRVSLGDFKRQLDKKFLPGIRLSAFIREYSIQQGLLVSPNFTHGIQQMILPKYENTPAAYWLNDIAIHTRRIYKQWMDEYITEPEKVLAVADIVAQLVNNLPTDMPPMHLLTYAAKFIDSPHDLDFQKEYGDLFLRALAHIYNAPVPQTVEDSIELYLKAGLLTGGVTCQVTVQGIDTTDEVCTFYNKLGQAHALTLEDVVRLPQANAYGGKVFIIENPLVFAQVSERLRGKNCTLVSPMNNHNPAFMRLLELFCASGNRLYYAGNMDYKGLVQADKLFLKFGEQFVPWRYTKSDYKIIVSKNSNILLDERKALDLHNEDIALVLSQLRKSGKIASSVLLVPFLVKDILKEGHHEK